MASMYSGRISSPFVASPFKSSSHYQMAHRELLDLKKSLLEHYGDIDGYFALIAHIDAWLRYAHLIEAEVQLQLEHYQDQLLSGGGSGDSRIMTRGGYNSALGIATSHNIHSSATHTMVSVAGTRQGSGHFGPIIAQLSNQRLALQLGTDSACLYRSHMRGNRYVSTSNHPSTSTTSTNGVFDGSTTLRFSEENAPIDAIMSQSTKENHSIRMNTPGLVTSSINSSTYTNGATTPIVNNPLRVLSQGVFSLSELKSVNEL
jgi:hypothetical protein